MGLPALGLVLWGWISGKTLRWSSFLVLFWIALSLGGKPAALLGAVLPLYHLVARSGYWMSLVVFMMAFGAAVASQECLKSKTIKPGLDFIWLGTGLLVYGAALCFGVPAELPSFWMSFCLYLLAGLLRNTPSSLRWVFLAGATFFSLWPAAQGVHFTMDRRFYEEPPILASRMTKPGRVYASYPEVEKFHYVSGPSVGESYLKLKNAMVSNWPLLYGKEECYFYDSFFLQGFFDWCFSSTRFSEPVSRKVLDYLNVRYVLGGHHFKGFRWIVKGENPHPLSENLQTYPKWFSVDQAIPQNGWNDDFIKLDRQNLSFGKVCFVEDSRLAGPYSPRRVTESEREPDRVLLLAEGSGRSLLVSSEMGYPGWRTYVEGKEAPTLSVNHGFRGLVLADGQQRVEMVFKPATFRLGLFGTLVTCCLWSFLVLAGLLKRLVAS